MVKAREYLVVAVSGGIDSVVLLDKLVKQNNELELIVAHFDHGIRDNSDADARFVAGLANKYGLVFESKREELGANASEALARKRRYQFLHAIAKKYQAIITTAHHMNDLAETIAINLQRGTGWRGLAVLDSDIYRPLLTFTKQDLIDHATDNRLEWCEDETNLTNRYLRNRLRVKLQDETMVRKLMDLRNLQTELKNQIDNELRKQQLTSPFLRQFFINVDESVAQEFLRRITDGRLTRPQMERSRQAIANLGSGKVFEAGNGVSLVFSSRYFTLEML